MRLNFRKTLFIYLFHIIFVAANGHLFAQNNYKFRAFFILTFDCDPRWAIFMRYECSFWIMLYCGNKWNLIVMQNVEHRSFSAGASSICWEGIEKNTIAIDLNKFLSLDSTRKYFDTQTIYFIKCNDRLCNLFILDARVGHFSTIFFFFVFVYANVRFVNICECCLSKCCVFVLYVKNWLKMNVPGVKLDCIVW